MKEKKEVCFLCRKEFPISKTIFMGRDGYLCSSCYIAQEMAREDPDMKMIKKIKTEMKKD